MSCLNKVVPLMTSLNLVLRILTPGIFIIIKYLCCIIVCVSVIYFLLHLCICWSDIFLWGMLVPQCACVRHRIACKTLFCPPPYMFQGSNLVTRLGSKHPFLLIHFAYFLFEMILKSCIKCNTAQLKLLALYFKLSTFI